MRKGQRQFTKKGHQKYTTSVETGKILIKQGNLLLIKCIYLSSASQSREQSRALSCRWALMGTSGEPSAVRVRSAKCLHMTQ